MNFIVETKVAPAGTICSLYVQGLVDDVWKVYPSVLQSGHSHYIMTGQWGQDEEDARRLLRKMIEKEVKKLSNHGDLRPSQVRRLDLLKTVLPTI
jgi:hypothetical protein